MKLPIAAAKLGLAAGLLGGATGFAIAAGLAPSPIGAIQPIRQDTTGFTPAADETHTVDAAGAGTVAYRVDGSTLTVVDATPAAGWTVEVEQSAGREVEVDFRSGTQRVQVSVEFEDGAARERVRTETDDDGAAAVNPPQHRDDDDRADEVGDDRGGDRDGDDDHAEDQRGDDDRADDDGDRSGSNSGHG